MTLPCRHLGPSATIPPSAEYDETQILENLSQWTNSATCRQQRPRSAHPSLPHERTPSSRNRWLPTPDRRLPAGEILDHPHLPHSRTTQSHRSNPSLLQWMPSPVLPYSASCRRRKTWDAADALLCDSFSFVKHKSWSSHSSCYICSRHQLRLFFLLANALTRSFSLYVLDLSLPLLRSAIAHLPPFFFIYSVYALTTLSVALEHSFPSSLTNSHTPSMVLCFMHYLVLCSFSLFPFIYTGDFQGVFSCYFTNFTAYCISHRFLH